MNNEQLEELEALSYIFINNEMERDNSVFEFKLEECANFRFQVIWPLSYPSSPLIFSIPDPRIPDSLKSCIEQECNDLVPLT
jgi:hypothetical protein